MRFYCNLFFIFADIKKVHKTCIYFRCKGLYKNEIRDLKHLESITVYSEMSVLTLKSI